MKDTFTIIYPHKKGQHEAKRPSTANHIDIVKSKKEASQRWSRFYSWMRSLGHALEWPQLKQQLTVPVLISHAKQNWFGWSLATLLLLLLLRNIMPSSTANQAGDQPQQAAILAAMQPTAHIGQAGQGATAPPTASSANTQKAQLSKAPQEEFVPPVIPDLKQEEKNTLKELGQHAQSLRDAFILRFVPVAQGEQEKYSIPGSISLGLAILHSEFGTSIIAKEGHNHFNISCEENPIPIGKGMTGQGIYGGNCYTRYSSDWMGFRAHSYYVKTAFGDISAKVGLDTKKWVAELDRRGYFRYNFSAKALLKTIDTYQLQKYDL